jgi:hypothetical protein
MPIDGQIRTLACFRYGIAEADIRAPGLVTAG